MATLEELQDQLEALQKRYSDVKEGSYSAEESIATIAVNMQAQLEDAQEAASSACIYASAAEASATVAAVAGAAAGAEAGASEAQTKYDAIFTEEHTWDKTQTFYSLNVTKRADFSYLSGQKGEFYSLLTNSVASETGNFYSLVVRNALSMHDAVLSCKTGNFYSITAPNAEFSALSCPNGQIASFESKILRAASADLTTYDGGIEFNVDRAHDAKCRLTLKSYSYDSGTGATTYHDAMLTCYSATMEELDVGTIYSVRTAWAGLAYYAATDGTKRHLSIKASNDSGLHPKLSIGGGTDFPPGAQLDVYSIITDRCNILSTLQIGSTTLTEAELIKLKALIATT